MRAELQDRLVKRFPFYRVDRDMRVTAMCWGFSHGDGWFNIIWNLSIQIERHLSSLPALTPDQLAEVKQWSGLEDAEKTHGFDVVQVKEKFGGLRFYTNWTTDYISNRIHDAKRLSVKTCEECGQPGRVRCNRVGYLQTLCRIHNQAMRREDNRKD